MRLVLLSFATVKSKRARAANVIESSGGNKHMYKRWLCFLVILSLSCSLMGQSSPAPKKADIEPGAMAALDKMGAYLRTLKAFQVKAVETLDDVLDNGQTV